MLISIGINFIIIFALELAFCLSNLGQAISFITCIEMLIYVLAIDLLLSIFKEKTRKLLHTILIAIITVIFIIYSIYFEIFGSALSIYSLTHGTQAIEFVSSLLKVLKNNWYVYLVNILICIIGIFAYRKINFKERTKKQKLIEIAILILTYIIAISCIIVFSDVSNIYSYKNLYFNVNNSNENLRNFGVLTTVRLDIQRTITNFKEKNLISYENANGEEIVIDKDEYNITDINFDVIAKSTDDEDVKEICNYLKTVEPTNKNEYTGIFEGKNLIVFVAESFSNLAISEELTPTLYKLRTEGINFENFYTPLFPVSTADGEYLTDTSLIPAEGTWSIEDVEGHTFPYSYANVLKNLGYTTYAYHDYYYDYYQRDVYFETMGYDCYLANGNGLEERMDFSSVPASDYEMVKTTVDDYINDDNFVAYYMTMSGHMNYDKSNAIVVKNWNLVKDLDYSDEVKGYLATQIELDRALEELINRLEEAGKLEDTVIVITGDHYPYGLTLDEMQELTDKELDDTFEQYNMPFIVYYAGQEEKISTDKYCSSLDVLPTILNLFGVEYDSRLLMGKDIFSDSEELVIFSSRSFITEKGRYNSWTESWSGIEIADTYVNEIKNIIYYKYKYSRLILETDFYSYIFK